MIAMWLLWGCAADRIPAEALADGLTNDPGRYYVVDVRSDEAAIDTVGAENVVPDCEPAACSEDFAQMLGAKPGCYLLIGNGTEGHSGRPLHNPGYDFNDEVLATGARYWVRLTENILG